MFGFSPGTDRREATGSFVVADEDDYYLVLRKGIFAPAGTVEVRIRITTPPGPYREAIDTEEPGPS